jgi:hypothetical protein
MRTIIGAEDDGATHLPAYSMFSSLGKDHVFADRKNMSGKITR